MTLSTFRLIQIIFVLALALGASPARAASCSGIMTNVSFGTVNPLVPRDVLASGRLTVTCRWDFGLGLLPNVNVCIRLGVGSGGGGTPRWLTNGSQTLAFNLYVDNSYTNGAAWGGPAIPGTAQIGSDFTGILGLFTASREFTVYGKIPGAVLAGASVAGGALYRTSFAGQGSVHFAFGTLLGQRCTDGGSSSFSFEADVTIASECETQAAVLDFGAAGTLGATRRASAVLNVRCTAGKPYQIVLDAGKHGSVAARKMRNAATGETIAYSLSNSAGGERWGDGTLGTLVHRSVGSGMLDSVTIHGTVPAQQTPSPGSYQDTVTVTITF